MDTQNEGYYLGIRFPGSEKSYFFSCSTNDFAIGDLVIVMTANGVEAGKVTALPQPLSNYTAKFELKSILRKADARDERDYVRNIEDAKKVMAITRKEVARLNLDMDLVDAFYTIDGSRVTITYTSSEKRVDFRELLKVLAPQIGCRIELRQLASRDKAKMVGGLGICGLPLCCSTFLNQFEGISIQRAKNQMLTLNIPKLSGPCGKLICCLTYEDDAYTEAKKEFPRFGTQVQLDEGPYSVDGINILSRTVRLVNASHSDYKTVSLEDVKAMMNGTYVSKVEIINEREAPLPSFGIEKDRSSSEKSEKPQQKDKNRDRRNDRENNGNKNRDDRRNDRRNDRQGRNNGSPQQNKQGNQRQKERPAQQQQQQNQNPNQNQNRNRHRHRHHGHGNRRGDEGNNA